MNLFKPTAKAAMTNHPEDTPLKLSAPAPEPGTHLRHSNSPLAGLVSYLPLIVLIITLTMTLFFWRLFDASLNSRAEALYREKTDDISNRIIKRLHDHEQVLRGGVGLFNVNNQITRDEWRTYVSSLLLGEYHPGILGVGFAAWITPQEKDLHIREIRSQGFPQYTIKPEGKRAEYTSIIYLEPFNWRNRRAFGYDMYSETVRRTAMKKAMDEGVATVTAKIILVQETEKDKQNGILMYVPVYRKGMATDSTEKRRAAILGFVYSPIRMNDFIYGTLGKLPDDIDFNMYASNTEDPASLMFSSGEVQKVKLPDDYTPDYRSAAKVEAYGRSWLISFRSLPAFSKEVGSNQSYPALAGGIAVSILLTLIALILLSARNKAFAMAQEIASKKEELEHSFARIKRLEGIIPICMYCKNIRSDNDSWLQLEAYISEHSEALFSHGICPQCFEEEMKKIKK